MTDRRERLRSLAAPGLSLAAGLLLFVADHPVHAWPVQAVALLPWLLALGWLVRSWRGALIAGLCLGAGYVAPLSFVLAFPLLSALGLAVYLIALWTGLSVGAYLLLGRAPVLGPLAVASLAVVIEFLDVSILPVWGTAQVFTRVWSAWPAGVQLVSFTGVLGLVFGVVAVQALVASLVLRPAARTRIALALAALLAIGAGASAWQWTRPPVGRIRVAALGWTDANLAQGRRTGTEVRLRETYERLLTLAVLRGAELVVSPETGFFVQPGEVPAFLARLGGLARRHAVHLAVGYFDVEAQKNRVALIDPRGRLLDQYEKTHLIMTLERYRPGSGRPVIVSLGRTTLGTMVCQDDNFTDLARAYGRSGVGVMAVPTNDWAAVSPYHLESSLLRAVEHRYALVRAATNGISVIATGRGEVLARMDHFQHGPGVVTATVPLYRGGGLHSHAGHWIVIPSLLLILAAAFAGRRRKGEPT
jgi:apolipoprotein N-acyltransferase